MDINVWISTELSDVWKKIEFTEVILIRLISFSVAAAILANAEGIEKGSTDPSPWAWINLKNSLSS